MRDIHNIDNKMLIWQELKSLVPYPATIELMESRVSGILSGSESETIFLVEHEDVYTAGTNAKPEELLNPQSVPVIQTGRGGKFTYHGKGQRVIYPVLNLALRTKDLRLYVRTLEKWIIATLKKFGIDAYAIDGRVGIWTHARGTEAKIGAIGVRVRKWVTYHGAAINISPDLMKFSGIVPCGISDAAVTSIRECGVDIDMQEFDEVLKRLCPW